MAGQNQAASLNRQTSLDSAAKRRAQLNQTELGLIGVEQARKQQQADILMDMAKSGSGQEAAAAGQSGRGSIGQSLSTALMKSQTGAG